MIKPLHDNVVLKKEKVENKTSSGIILTTESKSMPSVATVVAIGKDCKAEIKENDQVVYKEYSGTNIKIDEVEYIVISEKDILGRAYEYCLSMFAEQEGKLAGEFYTPSCVVRTLVEVLQPYNGRVYDEAVA